MDILIPSGFRTRWRLFFSQQITAFLGVDTVATTPIRNAILGFVQLSVAFGIVCVLGWAVTKIIKEIFG